MSERDRHSKRRSRDEAPDPEDRYDPKQGAKRSRKADEGSEPGGYLCKLISSQTCL